MSKELNGWKPIETAPFELQVLVCDKFKEFKFAFFHNKEEIDIATHQYFIEYWMPLPEPPKEKE